jgi:prepilin-type N-terminal cleavage/methylation domain-containing protein
MNRNSIRPRNEPKARGFSLVEMLIATLILLIGLLGIAQLIPASILINKKGRLDSTSLVFAQRVLDEMLAQKLTQATFIEENGALCNLGDPASPGVRVGNPFIFNGLNQPLIDFSVAPVSNYNFTYQDLNDPFRVTYDVRWAVVTTVQGSKVTGRRFIVGVRQLNGPGFVPAVTLDAMKEQ